MHTCLRCKSLLDDCSKFCQHRTQPNKIYSLTTELLISSVNFGQLPLTYERVNMGSDMFGSHCGTKVLKNLTSQKGPPTVSCRWHASIYICSCHQHRVCCNISWYMTSPLSGHLLVFPNPHNNYNMHQTFAERFNTKAYPRIQNGAKVTWHSMLKIWKALHTVILSSNFCRRFMADNFIFRVWPPRSSDLTPMGFFFWRVAEDLE